MVCPLPWQYPSHWMICLEAHCSCFRSSRLHSVFQGICRTVYIPRVRRCWDPGIWGPESLFSLSQRSPAGCSWRECSFGCWGKPSVSIWAHWLWWELWEVSRSRPMTSHFPLFFHVQGRTCRGHDRWQMGTRGVERWIIYTLDLGFSNFSMPNKNYLGGSLKFRVIDSALTNSVLR